MAIEITSNSDMPPCLNTEAKQFKKAKELARLHRDTPVKSARSPKPQGFFSRTVIITMKTGEELVFQFRPEALDMTPFQKARAVLGDVVPSIERIEDEAMFQASIWVYCMTCIAGSTCFHARNGRSAEGRLQATKTLGQILSKGHVAGDAAQVVHETIRPHLEVLLSAENSSIQSFHSEIKSMLDQVDSLAALPLYISHFDLNDVNIMVDNDCRVSGIVDWELSTKLPFGMGLCRIHTLAGFYSQQKFVMPPEFDQAERGFWGEIFDGMPKKVREIMEQNLALVDLSVKVGALLDTFQLDEGKVGGINPVAVEALPKFLTYRIPQSRGSGEPYLV
ncbi:hypothetical protein ONS95_001281 [Cadophora gregata]|uniref:uncharacterized protein n=1 Tax=Cadophora gregata TaxID=51156 RepID=UPI0026DDB27D|nr:uncharacterized protein ONS95_001281 [Cadophora gregata]KAK0101907.1 hypothetical protein ONS96_005881 [Cadophora gregata f. sp. sojae]KAK0129354.1 hypothetical protein ONS95_001281 [Cadophora gregata]